MAELRKELEVFLKTQLPEERFKSVMTLFEPTLSLTETSRFQPQIELELAGYAAKLSSVTMKRLEVNDLRLVHAGASCPDSVWLESSDRVSFLNQVRFLENRLERMTHRIPRPFAPLVEHMFGDILVGFSRTLGPYMRELTAQTRNDAVVELAMSADLLLKLVMGCALIGDWLTVDKLAPLARFLPTTIPICFIEQEDGSEVHYIFHCSPQDAVQNGRKS